MPKDNAHFHWLQPKIMVCVMYILKVPFWLQYWFFTYMQITIQWEKYNIYIQKYKSYNLDK